jgi:Spy/CpxP family protein refolding chaperone
MKTKFLPLLAGVAAITLIAAPMVVNAQRSNLLAQGPDKVFSNLNLTSEQQTQFEQIRNNTDSQIAGILNPEQQQQFQSIQTQRQQLHEAMKALNLTSEQKEQMHSIKQSAKQQMDSVLTDEQLQQLRQERQSNRNSDGSGRKHGPHMLGRGGPEALSNLNLTSEQKAQLEQIRNNIDSQIAGILTPEQQQKSQSIKAQRQQLHEAMKALNLTSEQKEQMHSIKESSRQQMDDLLTDEQRQQLRQEMGSRRGGEGRRQGDQ